MSVELTVRNPISESWPNVGRRVLESPIVYVGIDLVVRVPRQSAGRQCGCCSELTKERHIGGERYQREDARVLPCPSDNTCSRAAAQTDIEALSLPLNLTIYATTRRRCNSVATMQQRGDDATARLRCNKAATLQLRGEEVRRSRIFCLIKISLICQ